MLFPAPGYTRTRIAPTPSGFLHIGNVLSFSLTAALAQRYHAHTLLRIDDLDELRTASHFIRDIFDTLHFLGIPWDEGPRNVTDFQSNYAQQHRAPLYDTALNRLREAGAVFACTCSRADILKHNPAGIYPGTCIGKALPLDTPGAAWRLLTDNMPPVAIKGITDTRSYVLPEQMRCFVIRRKDGLPAYQLASVVDDLHFGVDLVVRGLDLLPSTIAQQYLARSAGMNTFAGCTCYHHDLLRSPDGVKLSKSAGATSVRFMRQEGKSPSGIFTLIAAHLGFHTSVHSWQELAALILPAS